MTEQLILFALASLDMYEQPVHAVDMIWQGSNQYQLDVEIGEKSPRGSVQLLTGVIGAYNLIDPAKETGLFGLPG